jgi:hypothetical protein
VRKGRLGGKDEEEATTTGGGGGGGGGVRALIEIIREQSELVFLAVLPHGNLLKCISELLYRCSSYSTLVASPDSLRLASCDPSSGRLIQITLCPQDMVEYQFFGINGGFVANNMPLRVTLDASSLYAVSILFFLQKKKKDASDASTEAAGPTVFMTHENSCG